MIRINFNPGNQSVPWIAAMPYAHRAWSATLAFAVMAGTPGLAHSAVKPAPAAHEPSSQPLAEVVVVGNRSDCKKLHVYHIDVVSFKPRVFGHHKTVACAAGVASGS